MARTIQFRYREYGESVDPEYVVLRNPTNTFGVRREDDGTVIVPAGTALTRVEDGVFEYSFDEPLEDLAYEYWLEWRGTADRIVRWLNRTLSVNVDPLATHMPEEPPRSRNGCKITLRTPAWRISEGVIAAIQLQLKDRKGAVIPLVTAVESQDGESESESEGLDVPADVIVARFAEWMAEKQAHVVLESLCRVVDAPNGIVQALVPDAIRSTAGVYLVSFGLIRRGRVVHTQEGMLNVQSSLMALSSTVADRPKGPPTPDEIRMAIWDSSPQENVLLEDHEFGIEQITAAIVRALSLFNESQPPLPVRFNTHNFPWREQLLNAVVGYLYESASLFYKRNRQQVSAAGVSVDDLNRGDAYKAVADEKLNQWKTFITMKRIEINSRAFYGVVSSGY